MQKHVCWIKSLVLKVLIVGSCWQATAQAELIELKLNNGIMVEAEYHQGETGMSSIMILHGFLQTRDFYTVKRLADSLIDSGYSVLMPTLSLGLNRRNKSMDCEAIHFHSMEADIIEIELWVDWLHKKSGNDIILIGHSAGSVFELAYLDQAIKPPVKQAIFISVSYFGSGPYSHETPADAQRARQVKNELGEFGLTFCEKYISPGSNYLSYYDWNRSRVLNAIKKQSIPIATIIGENDRRLAKDWVSVIQENMIKVQTVPGANHFFDNEYEFELQDAIDDLLKSM